MAVFATHPAMPALRKPQLYTSIGSLTSTQEAPKIEALAALHAATSFCAA